MCDRAGVGARPGVCIRDDATCWDAYVDEDVGAGRAIECVFSSKILCSSGLSMAASAGLKTGGIVRVLG